MPVFRSLPAEIEFPELQYNPQLQYGLVRAATTYLQIKGSNYMFTCNGNKLVKEIMQIFLTRDS